MPKTPANNLLLTGRPGCGKTTVVQRVLERISGQRPMECFSRVFIENTPRVLDGPLPVLATIAAKGGGFISRVKARGDIEVFAVTVATRDGLPELIAERLLPA